MTLYEWLDGLHPIMQIVCFAGICVVAVIVGAINWIKDLIRRLYGGTGEPYPDESEDDSGLAGN